MNEDLIKFIEFVCLKKAEEFENLSENIINDNRVPNKISFTKKNNQTVEWLYFYQSITGHSIFLDSLDFEYIKNAQ